MKISFYRNWNFTASIFINSDIWAPIILGFNVNDVDTMLFERLYRQSNQYINLNTEFPIA